MIADVIPPATLGVMTVSRAMVFVRVVMTVRSVIVPVIPATVVMETVISAVILLRADVLLVRVVVLLVILAIHLPVILVIPLVNLLIVVVVIQVVIDVRQTRTVPNSAGHTVRIA